VFVFLLVRLFVFEKNVLFFLFQEVSADRRWLFFRLYVASFQHFAVCAGKSREKKAKSSGVWRKSRELFIESWEGVSEVHESADVFPAARDADAGVVVFADVGVTILAILNALRSIRVSNVFKQCEFHLCN